MGTLWRPAAELARPRRPSGSQGSSAAACPSSTTLTTQHGEHQQQLTNGTLEICTCTGSTDRDEPPTGRHCTAMEEMTRHRDTRTSRMQTPGRPDGRQGAELGLFSSLRKGGRTVFCEADQLFRLSLLEESTICFAFSALTCQSLEKSSRVRQENLPFPFPLPAPSTRGWLRPQRWVLNAH